MSDKKVDDEKNNLATDLSYKKVIDKINFMNLSYSSSNSVLKIKVPIEKLDRVKAILNKESDYLEYSIRE